MNERVDKLRESVEKAVDEAICHRQPGRIVPVWWQGLIDQNDVSVLEAIMKPYELSGWNTQIEYFLAEDIGWLILLIPSQPSRSKRRGTGGGT